MADASPLRASVASRQQGSASRDCGRACTITSRASGESRGSTPLIFGATWRPSRRVRPHRPHGRQACAPPRPIRAVQRRSRAVGPVRRGARARRIGPGPTGRRSAARAGVFTGAASCSIAIEFGFTGPNSTNGMSCASGALAIGHAFQLIRRGEADVAVAGGAECPLSPLSYARSH